MQNKEHKENILVFFMFSKTNFKNIFQKLEPNTIIVSLRVCLITILKNDN